MAWTVLVICVYCQEDSDTAEGDSRLCYYLSRSVHVSHATGSVTHSPTLSILIFSCFWSLNDLLHHHCASHRRTHSCPLSAFKSSLFFKVSQGCCSSFSATICCEILKGLSYYVWRRRLVLFCIFIFLSANSFFRTKLHIGSKTINMPQQYDNMFPRKLFTLSFSILLHMTC